MIAKFNRRHSLSGFLDVSGCFVTGNNGQPATEFTPEYMNVTVAYGCCRYSYLHFAFLRWIEVDLLYR
jgi:hypothetical protein